jgi:DNA-directed RNA polymerase specialized sigma24 family protein
MREAGFQKFVEILRNGDAEAVDRLLADLDPFLRRAIRMRLCDRRTRRVVDTSDILQSLLKDYLSREGTDAGAASSRRLHAYLTAAAKYKIGSKTRKERRRTADFDDVLEPVSPEPTPSRQAEDRDFINAVRSRLDEGNRRLFDLSQQGRTWRQIAIEVGGNPDTLRIQLRRSVAAALAEIRGGESIHAE